MYEIVLSNVLWPSTARESEVKWEERQVVGQAPQFLACLLVLEPLLREEWCDTIQFL